MKPLSAGERGRPARCASANGSTMKASNLAASENHASAQDIVLAVPHHAPVRRDLPFGTVTFLFTDVEGSTRLLHELGAEAYSAALLKHRLILRETFARHGGVEVDTQGDAFFFAFPTAPGAVDAAR